ncbi:unnamed protein product [Discosporangium mesarthrocarpum]
MADTARQLRIKVGVCKRMVKEVAGYEKEAKENEVKVQKMRDDGKDPYDIRKQEEASSSWVLQESYMMIPDSKDRLQTSLEDLRAFLAENEGGEGLEDQITEAKAIIEEAGVST